MEDAPRHGGYDTRRPGLLAPGVDRSVGFVGGLLGINQPSFAEQMAARDRQIAEARARGVPWGEAITQDIDAPLGLMMGMTAPTPGRLPMDTASRLARAQEQGYRPVYHGTDQPDIRAFQNPHGGEPGHFVSPDPQIAGQYPFATSRRAFPEEGRNVMPLMLRGRMFDVNAPVSDAAVAGWRTAILEQVPARMRDNIGRDFDALMANAPVERRGPVLDRYLRIHAPVRYEPFLRERGYTGVDRGAEIQVFDPQNLRSVHAAFDPAQRGSADLLASRWWLAPAGAGTGASLFSGSGASQ